MRNEKRIVKKILVLSVLLIFTLSINSQIKKISTGQIREQLVKNGIDSAIASYSWSRTPLYKIDSILYFQMADSVTNFHSKHLDFVANGANSYQSPTLAQKMLQFVKEYTSELKEKAIASKYKKVKIIDEDAYLLILIKQKDDSIEKYFKDEYDFWKNATEIGNKKESHYNCLKMMLALKELGSPYYSESSENFHRENVKKSDRDRKLRSWRYVYEYKEYETSIVDLKNKYDRLEDINFEEETELAKMFGMLSSYKNDNDCWSELIYKDNKAILDLGCQWGPLSGVGTRCLVELVDKNKLRVITLDSWIS